MHSGSQMGLFAELLEKKIFSQMANIGGYCGMWSFKPFLFFRYDNKK